MVDQAGECEFILRTSPAGLVQFVSKVLGGGLEDVGFIAIFQLLCKNLG